MPDGNEFFSGGSGPTWNDAMMAGEILRSGSGQTYAGRPAPTPAQLRQWRHRAVVRAAFWSVLAGLFLIGAGLDALGPHPALAVVPLLLAGIMALGARHFWRTARRYRDG